MQFDPSLVHDYLMPRKPSSRIQLLILRDMPRWFLDRLSSSLKLIGEAPDHIMRSMRMQDPTSNIHISLLIMCINPSEKALVWILDDQATFQQLLLVAFLVVGGASRGNTRESARISTRTRKLDSTTNL